MGITFVDICECTPATPTPSEVDLLRDQVDRLEAKRAYDKTQMRHIRRILRAVDMPASPQGTISRNAIASPMWQVLMLAKAAMGLCAEVDRLQAELETYKAAGTTPTVVAPAEAQQNDIDSLRAEIKQLQQGLTKSGHYALGLQYELTDASKALENTTWLH